MDFSFPPDLSKDLERFRDFLRTRVKPDVSKWYGEGTIPRSFFHAMGEGGWFGFRIRDRDILRLSVLREALLTEELAFLCPGVAIAALVHGELGITGLRLFGSEFLKGRYGVSAISGKNLLCLGSTENSAGSDVAGILTRAEKVAGGWLLNGTKSYVTNGLDSDLALITAVSHPGASRNYRLSMFLVDLNSRGVTRKRLNKQVWIPSDLTRIKLSEVFVPEDHLLGEPGKGLQQVLTIFTNSRIAISALTLGTASGAFELALDHAVKRKIFGHRIIDHQAKAFEIADFHARIEAARLMLMKACWTADNGEDFRLEASTAKYLTVAVARDVTSWAADLFGASSVIFESPVHRFPMDAWASSLGEGTQDVQKLVIFRNLMARRGIDL